MLGEIMDMVNEDHNKMPYVMTGKVLMNFNPLHPASVQVELYDRSLESSITAWARVAMPYAGAGHTIYSLPDIGDEVLVAFCQGEIDAPVVIGSLHSIQNMPPPEVLNPLNNIKETKTRAGHTLKLDDLTGIKIESKAKLTFDMDDMQMGITLKDVTGMNTVQISGTQGTVAVKGLSEVSVKSGACQITLDGKTQSVSIKAPTVTVEGMQALNLKGMQINLKGQLVSIAADAQLDIKSTGPTNIKGAIVKIN